MALDREKVLQTAQKYVSKKKYDKAIAEYQKIVQKDPNDARTLLKIGDLQTRMEAYAEAIATYDRVGQFYSSKGFALKAIAVYKQIRELIQKHVPQLSDRYGHIVPKLAEIYTQLGLTSDALAAYDEVATRFQRAGRDRDAIEIFQKMVSLDSTNPLPHLRLAEACCRVQSVDDAIDSFWTAAELLIKLQRRDDALKVVERILHFRQDAKYARVAAQLYLARQTQPDALQALAKLQLCFQQDPKDLDTLELLSQAFRSIGQEPKAIEVKKEMVRIARDAGRDDVLQHSLGYLLQVAPNDEQVRAMAQQASAADAASVSSMSVDDVELLDSSISASAESLEPDDFDDIDFDEEPHEHVPQEPQHPQPQHHPRPFMASAPEVEVEEIDYGARLSSPAIEVDEGLEAAEELIDPDSEDARAHARKAVVDAESFRGLRLYSKAIETLRIALEIDPRSVEIREKLRDVLAESGDRDGAIGEMITLAAIYMDKQETHKAEASLYQVLEAEPNHPTACEMLEQLGGIGEETEPGYVPEQAGGQYGAEDTYSTTDEMSAPQHQAYGDPDTFDDDDIEAFDEPIEELESDVFQEAPAEPEAIAPPYNPDQPLPSYDFEEVPAEAAIANQPDELLEELDDDFGERQPSDVPLPSFPLQQSAELDAHLEEEQAAHADAEFDAVEPDIPRAASVPDLGVPQEDAQQPSEAVEEALDEAEFFTSRGLWEDAKMILTDQLSRTPNHPLLLERIQEIEAQSGDAGKSGTHDRSELDIEEPDKDRAFDIAASLDAFDELEQATRSSRPPAALKPVDEVDVDQVFAKFKEGVRAQVDESDSSTHYDLGVAYKEMGLHGDAVNEFAVAAKDPKIECMCFAMVGMIHLEQGDLDKSAEAYIRGLGATQKTIEQEMSLYYDLGNVYEMKGSTSEALYYFEKIARRDPGYRDIKDRIRSLKPGTTSVRPPGNRKINEDEDFDAAFDDLFESK